MGMTMRKTPGNSILFPPSYHPEPRSGDGDWNNGANRLDITAGTYGALFAYVSME